MKQLNVTALSNAVLCISQSTKKTNELFFVAMHKPSKEPAKWYKVTPYVVNGLVRVYEVLYEYTDDFVYSNFTIAKP